MTLEHFFLTRKRTEDFCKPLSIEDYTPQVALHASPMKWQLGHTTWFFETFILKKYQSNYRVFNENFSFLFNSYYNNIGDRLSRDNRGVLTRPYVEEVYAYRKYVDKEIELFFNQHNNDETNTLLEIGINHEEQHQELMITDLKLLFFSHPFKTQYKPNGSLLEDIINKEKDNWININEGIYEVGFKGEGFSYDNEHGVHKVYLQQFQISQNYVSNKEYIAFIKDGGYNRFELWLDEGWTWVKENNITHPLYWELIDNNWCQFTLGGVQIINPNSILGHINFYEAEAFARWKGMRLPTEFEWEVASEYFNWGKRWEWTNSAYLPYPGFKTAEGALGEYNGKFMINTMVLRGGSVATSPNHSRNTYRNFFHPNYRWQYSGIRLAK
ncbi:ergothioneine biosynthesis protein EgtB [Flammeovirga kamogawensis]|uniref:Ergothioneine biosynthesis protein EgtB n=1 Tax=Flammeovirga kamogawensis TaxID=373891 RepID=A0ABX8GRS6_9BACT|nr:ergothioneine biosynthesis protein EgtB [Flammeovirga kamogawensis]MBB6464018.1 ergothioneine biosynthesis protein EgtB [Flammeovirga kamogawensis]QWG06104.1 ergothioneine biosynthesis protein EgtB [Flammeovirga kamogawensis]TRX67936.1 ergothioneine biosynthesis protein EgtB [Flammeovirga kamogawensis]